MALASTLAALSGWSDSGDARKGGFAGEWVRVGFPDCEATIPLQELPVKRPFIYATETTVEQGGAISLSVNGRGVWNATVDGHTIGSAASYSVYLDADPPLHY